MKPPSKPILIAGGVALAAGAIWYIKKSEKPKEEFLPTAPTTYYGGQEAAGNFGGFNSGGGFGGGGAPTAEAPGVTTAPVPESFCKNGEQVVGISAIGGKPGGLHCIRNRPPCPEGKRAVGISAVAGQPGGIRCV